MSLVNVDLTAVIVGLRTGIWSILQYVYYFFLLLIVSYFLLDFSIFAQTTAHTHTHTQVYVRVYNLSRWRFGHYIDLITVHRYLLSLLQRIRRTYACIEYMKMTSD